MGAPVSALFDFGTDVINQTVYRGPASPCGRFMVKLSHYSCASTTECTVFSRNVYFIHISDRLLLTYIRILLLFLCTTGRLPV